ncbi:MAG: hypothetical protein WAL32_08605 [Terriglobales bacterium]
MANKKKTSKRAKAKKSVSKKLTKRVNRPKKPTKRKPAPKKTTKGKAKKPVRQRRGRAQSSFLVGEPDLRSGGQSGDLQGLSDVESADSESVDELLEEGNAFEADAVKGVEDAGDFDEKEVHTHEVPEDDVPEEYLDEQ